MRLCDFVCTVASLIMAWSMSIVAVVHWLVVSFAGFVLAMDEHVHHQTVSLISSLMTLSVLVVGAGWHTRADAGVVSDETYSIIMLFNAINNDCYDAIVSVHMFSKHRFDHVDVLARNGIFVQIERSQFS